MKKQRGFTLIELLVVIAIIGLLATVVLVSLNTAREKARDAKRKSDINQLQLALQLYYDDNNVYPGESWCDSSVGSCGHSCPCSDNNWTSGSTFYTALVGGGYIANLPVDPTNNSNYYYNYEPDCNQGVCIGLGCCYFRLTARLEEGGSFRLEGY